MRAMREITLPNRTNACELGRLCQYVNDKPFIGLHRYTDDRVKLVREGEWIATVVPPGILVDDQYVLLSYPDSEHEFRVNTLAEVGTLISVLQQSGCDWDKVYEVVYPDDDLDLNF